MTEKTEKASNFLAVTLVLSVFFQIFLSVLILRELRQLPAGISAGGSSGEILQGLALGTAAPPFRLADSEGEPVTLEEFRGRKVMLVFSSDQCRFCKKIYPELKRFEESGDPQRLQVVMLQVGSTPAENKELALSQGFDFPVLAADQEVFLAYQVSGTPFSTVIDEAGLITATGVITSYQQMASLTGSAVNS